jgi:transcriptional regulator with XRE-family HTH domain
VIVQVSKMKYHTDMSLVAVGAYLKTLREARGLTLADVASRSSTSETQVIRVESGKIDTRGSLLMHLVHAVEGDPADVFRLSLMREPSDDPDDAESAAAHAKTGQDAARALLARPEQGEITAPFARLPAEQQRLLADVAQAMLGAEPRHT